MSPRPVGSAGWTAPVLVEWKWRFQTQGFEGLKDLPPIHKSHPQTTPPEVVEKIRDLAVPRPCDQVLAKRRMAS